jgi:hypothetical protein
MAGNGLYIQQKIRCWCLRFDRVLSEEVTSKNLHSRSRGHSANPSIGSVSPNRQRFWRFVRTDRRVASADVQRA